MNNQVMSGRVVMPQVWKACIYAVMLLFIGLAMASSASAAPTPEDFYFEDDFETGNMSNSNEYFEWEGRVNTSVSTDIARSGDYSLKFSFICCDAGGDTYSEQKYLLSEDIDEIWISWYQYYPDGNELATIGKDLGPKWHHRTTPSSDNNKLLRIGTKVYEDDTINSIFGYSAEPTSLGDSTVMVEYREDGEGMGNNDQPYINGGVLVDDSIRGRWVEYIAHFKISSGWQVADGKAELWVDGLKIDNHHDLNSWPSLAGPSDAARNVFNHGYIMGWANSGHDEDSFTYIDDFVVSAGPPPTLGPEDLEPEDPPLPPEDNLALGKVTATSSNESGSLSGSRTVDGDTGTRWASASGSDPQWISVDLGDTYTIDQVILNWETAYASGYQLQVSSNGTTWTNVYATTSGDGGIDDIPLTPVEARYVRMYGTQRGTVYGYSLYEFEVYGADPQPVGDNVALSKSTATSSNESGTLTGSRAVDGNPGTRWASVQQSDPEWISVDLGADYTINYVILHWEAAYGKSYKIQISSNGTTWTDVYATTSGDGGIDEIPVTPVEARYVRMYGTQRGTIYGFSLYEFEIYGE